ncbi:ATP-grasp domain-containing protein [Blastococcus goldschmidtiae]|uniref:ATP-grasp domain-containing protein n=1 Tax=Blastococcus goldschmidtiae TaxID=3075546 RepID=A0ABU2KB16_9ACTN|nr:ATP-grasp domain-containing protein [Blastococcus sp. DSM 46792]MDT0277385.1 ATP-grasp domain-containing protein [Blastococcus sp. DSM 46792]
MDHANGSSRSAVAAVRALAVAGYRPFVTVSGRPSAAAASRSCAGVLRTPQVNSPDFRTAVEDHVATHPGTGLLAASDAVLCALDLPGSSLADKAALPKLAEAAGLSTPPTYEFADAATVLDAAGQLEYPIVVKAAVKSGSGEEASRVDSAADLPKAMARLLGSVVVQPFARGAMRSVSGVIADGELLAVAHQRYVRIWPADCGTASAAVTTEPDRELERRLPYLLAGHAGVFQVQFVGDQVIDVNPRVYGSLPLAVAAGANLPAIACRAAAGDRPTEVVRARPGVRYRWLAGDVQRLAHDVRRGSTTLGAASRALRPHPGTAPSVESWRDPGPALVRVAEIVRRRLR